MFSDDLVVYARTLKVQYPEIWKYLLIPLFKLSPDENWDKYAPMYVDAVKICLLEEDGINLTPNLYMMQNAKKLFEGKELDFDAWSTAFQELCSSSKCVSF